MSRRFDRKTNVFDQNGRIGQIENAIQAIKNSGPSLAFHYKDGIVIGTEKKISSTLLLPPKHGEKIFMIDKHLYVITSGLSSDANYLIEYIRKSAQSYKFDFSDYVPIEQLVEKLCDLKQSYTQFGGMRPFGSAFIFVGYDKHRQFQIYTSDPSGNMACWRAIAQGANQENSNNLLQENFSEGMDKQSALIMGLETIMQTLDTSEPDVKKLELALIEKISPEGQEVRMIYIKDSEKEEILKKIKEKKTK